MRMGLFYIWAEFKHHPFHVFHQFLFFIPVVFIGVSLVMVAVAPSVNQMIAVTCNPYAGFQAVSDASQGTFTVADCDVFGSYDVDPDGGIQAQTFSCSVYALPSEDDETLHASPFNDAYTFAGKAASSLVPGEAMLTRQTALAAGVNIGDEFYIVVGNDDFTKRYSVTLAGVLETRYAPGELSSYTGMAYVSTDKKLLSKLKKQGEAVAYYKELPSVFTGKTAADELDEAQAILVNTPAYLTFLVLMAALVLVLLAKETAYLLRKRQYSIAVMCACGEPATKAMRCLMLEELMVLCVSNVVAIALACMVMNLPQVARPAPFIEAIVAFALLFVIEGAIVKVYSSYLQRKISTRNLLKLMTMKGAPQWD